MKKLFFFLACVSAMSLSSIAAADAYSCAKMVYAKGWLIKYEYKGNTWGANTQKHGVLSSTVGSSTEGTTSSVDPGYYTGSTMSSLQYSSSWGECSMLDYHITKQFREDYIEQNMVEIKKHVALGDGVHVASLAYLSGCKDIEESTWVNGLRSHMEPLYDAETGARFAEEIDQVIKGNVELKSKCHMPELS